MGALVRGLRLSDLEHVAAFYREIRADSVALVHGHDDVVAWMAAVLMPRGSSFVVESEGQVVAWLDLWDGSVEQLYCMPGETGRGWGKALLDFAKIRCPGGLSLHTFQCNTQAIAFYEREGFVLAGKGDGSGNEEGAPDVLMEWRQG